MEQSDRPDLVKKTTDLTKNIQQLSKELEQLQNECNHPESVIKQQEGGRVLKYCKDCGKEIGYPTQQELENYLYGNKGSTRENGTD